jgi:thiol-disulfide isomerase/thioredoxin
MSAAPAQNAHTDHSHHGAAGRTAKSPLNFDEKSWAKLVKQGPRPAAYLFTTTYCSTCPAAFEVLHRAVKESRQKVPLAAVIMDADGQQAQSHVSHFAGMTQL